MSTRARCCWLAPALGLFLLAGCSGVLESRKPARQVYLLQPPPITIPETSPAAATVVLSVKAVPGLDTDRILVLGPDARLNPVANAHWADHLPEVFRSITRRTLAESGRFDRVTVGTIARPDQWLLEIELQEFYGVGDRLDGVDRVRLRLDAALSCGAVRERIVLQESTLPGQPRISELVAAHQRALDAALGTLPERIVAHCAER